MYEADDLILNRRVAIKVPRAEDSDSELLDEARVLAALTHPALPEVHATGRHERMRFLVMELLVGVTLEAYRTQCYAKGKSISLREAIDILVDICGALKALHGAGVAHRDLKPDNVMLSGDRGTVLVDCGLVASEANVNVSSDRLHGASPFYVAPEALTGTTAPGAGRLSDLYSLGIVAYELLTGSVPYNAGDIETLTRLHVEAPIPDARMLRPNLPSSVAELVLELMAKKPGERPQATDEVLWRLQAAERKLPKLDGPVRAMAMIVSDDLGFSSELRHRLDHWVSQVEVVVHHSCRAALDALAGVTPQLLLFDRTIGDMTMMGFVKELREASFDGPEAIVILTDEIDAEELDELRGLDVRSIMPRGKRLGAMLEPVVRNVLAPTERMARD
jgi:serine/threonine-protein kinase